MISYKNTFVECYVTKKRTAKRVLTALGCIFGTIVITLVILFFMSYMGAGAYAPFYALTALLLCIALSFILIKLSFWEFEYSFYNGDMTIFKIIGKARRKPQISFNYRDIEIFAKCTKEHQADLNAKYTKTIDAASEPDARGRWYAIVSTAGQRILVIFEPSEKLIAAYKEILPIRKFKDY